MDRRIPDIGSLSNPTVINTQAVISRIYLPTISHLNVGNMGKGTIGIWIAPDHELSPEFFKVIIVVTRDQDIRGKEANLSLNFYPVLQFSTDMILIKLFVNKNATILDACDSSCLCMGGISGC